MLLISVIIDHQKEIDRNSQADISPTWLNTLRIGEKLYMINDTKNDILLPKDNKFWVETFYITI
jgi:hypothetical protein